MSYKLRWVYQCDICNTISLPQKIIGRDGIERKTIPRCWKRYGKFIICNNCQHKYELMLQLKEHDLNA